LFGAIVRFLQSKLHLALCKILILVVRVRFILPTLAVKGSRANLAACCCSSKQCHTFPSPSYPVFWLLPWLFS